MRERVGNCETRCFAHGPDTVLEFAWESDASGDVEFEFCAADFGRPVTGALYRLDTWPDDNAAPTDEYDVTLTDLNGADVLETLGGNRSTSARESAHLYSAAYPFLRSAPVDDLYTLVVENAGNAKRGTLRVFLRPVDA